MGHNIFWFTSEFEDKKNKKIYNYSKINELPSIIPSEFFSSFWKNIDFAVTSSSKLEQLFSKEKIDLVYITHPTLLWFQASRAADKLWIVTVAHSHVQSWNVLAYLPTRLKVFIKDDYITWILAEFYKKCNGVIYPTTFAKQELEKYNISNESSVISNWVNSGKFNLKKNTNDNKLIKMLYVGRLDEEKNVTIIIEAINYLKNHDLLKDQFQTNLVWIGNCYESIKDLIYDYWLSNHIVLKGRISEAELITIYQEASFFILPSLFELESMATLEAMSSWLPVIIANSKRSAAPSFVDDNWLLFDPNSIKDLSEKIYTLYTDQKLRQKYSNNSRKIALQHNFENSVKKMESFFLEIFRKHNPLRIL